MTDEPERFDLPFDDVYDDKGELVEPTDLDARIAELAMTTTQSPMCLVCRHFDVDSDDNACAAFPEGIPSAIFFEGTDHREPFAGDNGIRFEATDSPHVEVILRSYPKP